MLRSTLLRIALGRSVGRGVRDHDGKNRSRRIYLRHAFGRYRKPNLGARDWAGGDDLGSLTEERWKEQRIDCTPGIERTTGEVDLVLRGVEREPGYAYEVTVLIDLDLSSMMRIRYRRTPTAMVKATPATRMMTATAVWTWTTRIR